jgi:hypothetical protein
VLDTLLVFGSAQWAWTWFRPDGPNTVEQVGSALVDLVLGSLLVDRDRVAELADAGSPIVQVVRAAIRDAAEEEPEAEAS